MLLVIFANRIRLVEGMKFTFRIFFLLSIGLLNSDLIWAEGNPDGPPICFPPPCVPITDHIGWLIAALVGFGLLKTWQYSRKETIRS